MVSNRGPLAFRLDDGRPVAAACRRRVGRIAPSLLRGTGATWVACALDEADRVAAAAGLMNDGRAPDRARRPRTRDIQHGLQRGVERDACGSATTTSSTPPAGPAPTAGGWRHGRRTGNSTSCSPKRWPSVAPEGGRVLVQDYHLALMGSELGRLRPDLRTVHFTHTPFADPSDAAHAADRRWAASC